MDWLCIHVTNVIIYLSMWRMARKLTFSAAAAELILSPTSVRQEMGVERVR